MENYDQEPEEQRTDGREPLCENRELSDEDKGMMN